MRLDHLPEWQTPSEAITADLGSQQRLQAAIICACLDLDSQIQACMSRAEERKLKEQFERLRGVGILVASLMKREGT